MKENNLEPSMSRRSNCLDNAAAESFFAAFKNVLPRKRFMKHVTKPEARYLILLRCFTIQ
jgi:putative transposase